MHGGAIPGRVTPELSYKPNGNCAPGLVVAEVRNGLPECRKPYLWHGKPGLAELNARILADRATRRPVGRPPRPGAARGKAPRAEQRRST